MRWSSVLIALTLLGTGCSGSDAPPAELSANAEPPTSTSQLPSSGATPTSSPDTPPSTPPETPEPPAPTSESSNSADSGLSPRGNLVKEIGEAAGIIDGNGELLVNFVINSISPDVLCTEEPAEPAENGVFIAVDVSVQTSPAMAAPDALLPSFDMSPSLFRTISPEGISSNASPDTFAAFLCLDDTALLPGSIGPGESARGIVLLDVEYPAGTLIFEDFYTDSAWEWNYPG